MKTLTKKQQQKNQRPTSKQNKVQLRTKAGTSNTVKPEAAPEQLSAYDSYYKQVSEEVETIERHVRELRQTPGLEGLSEDEAHVQVDFMLRFCAWVFNQHLAEEVIATIGDVDVGSAKLSKAESQE